MTTTTTDRVAHLMELRSRYTKKDAIRRVLEDGLWHNADELYRVGGQRFSARIGELRRDDNLVIIQRRNKDNGRQDYQLIGLRTAETERWAREYDAKPDKKKPVYFDECEAAQLMQVIYATYLRDPEAFKKSKLGPVYGRLRKIAPADFDPKKTVRAKKEAA